MVFPSLEEFSTVCCDPHKGFGIVNKEEANVSLNFLAFFLASPLVLLFFDLIQGLFRKIYYNAPNIV